MQSLKQSTLPVIADIRVAVRSRAGSTQNQAVKINQDATISIRFSGYYFFAVCDGHGVNGHYVSNHIKKTLPINLNKQLNVVTQNSQFHNQSIMKAFLQCNKELSQYDTSLSGSTVVSVLIKDQQVYCANVGDSRAVLYSRNPDWTASQLSIDHKPYLPKERARIINCDGRIVNERVYLQSIEVPGLAMTRSFGDKIAATVGVIAEPEIIEFQRNKSHKFIVIASDGVWDQLTNEEVMQIVIPFYRDKQVELATERVVKEAFTRWRSNSPMRDDITCKQDDDDKMTQASLNTEAELEEKQRKDLYKVFGFETGVGKELFNLYNIRDRPKVNYPKPKQKTQQQIESESMKTKKPCPQKTQIEYPKNEVKSGVTYHPVDFIMRRKPESEIRKEIEAYYAGMKFYRPPNRGRNRKELIEELQQIFKYKRGALPKGAELPEVDVKAILADQSETRTNAIKRTHQKDLYFTQLKPQQEQELEGDPLTECEILLTQILQEIKERQEFLEEVEHLDEPNLKKKIKDEIIERVSELQKVSELKKHYQKQQ